MKPNMMMNTTLNQLRSLRLETMAQALEQQLMQSGIGAMSFEERLALLVDREVHGRQDRRCARLLKTAKLKYPQAAIEDLDSCSTRGIERSAVTSLALAEWVNAGHAVLITGATGASKSWLACTLAQHACRRGYSALRLAGSSPGRGTAHSARQRHLYALVGHAQKYGRLAAGRLGHGRHGRSNPGRSAGDH
ncbi:MAG: replication protein [Polaromonas sp.]|nr:replication protein [Polaromonas sp.]